MPSTLLGQAGEPWCYGAAMTRRLLIVTTAAGIVGIVLLILAIAYSGPTKIP